MTIIDIAFVIALNIAIDYHYFHCRHHHRELVVPSSGGKTIVFAEAIGNPFLRLKTDFMEQLIGGGGGRGVRVAGVMEGAAEATPQPVAAGSKKVSR